ncbi:hypothetical protein [Clostridium sp. OS1-26]|uniref:hypothetical protein n=1 Tax=Clostridium sp. OS1-26 TaxID=3070681 RepID=UPI0027E0E644|nr:hypothetical protein [Clostridium sp. OS1-26]WML36900.1 hypothetical protein RCG18_09935 [Clostridium sp. OS1-26]
MSDNKENDINKNKSNENNIENSNDLENNVNWDSDANLENDIKEQFEENDEILINDKEDLYKDKVEQEDLNCEISKSEDNIIDKYQIQKDNLIYERNLLEYKDWFLKGKEMLLKSMKTFDNINFIVEKFNQEISKKLEILSDEEKRLIENRTKGINMINKMSKNSINNSLSKLLDEGELDFSNIKIVNELDNKNEEEIRMILNQNYSNISRVESEKLNLINKYFNFIEGNLLSIIDGIESGISFVKSSTNEIIENVILPTYMELKKCFDELLTSINVNKIEIAIKTKINFSYTEVLDIQETEDGNLDETIESVVRDGYEYSKDIYEIGHNHIIRQAQIVAYKSYSKN